MIFFEKGKKTNGFPWFYHKKTKARFVGIRFWMWLTLSLSKGNLLFSASFWVHITKSFPFSLVYLSKTKRVKKMSITFTQFFSDSSFYVTMESEGSFFPICFEINQRVIFLSSLSLSLLADKIYVKVSSAK